MAQAQLIALIVTSVLSIIEAIIRNQESLRQPVDPVLLAERERLRKVLVELAGSLAADTPAPPPLADGS